MGSLKDALSDWERLGLELGIKYPKIKEIKRSHRPEELYLCMADLLQHWMGSDTDASWEKMAITLDEMDKRDIAMKIRGKIGPPETDGYSYIPPST